MGNAKEREEVFPKSTTLFKLGKFEGVFTCAALMQATRHRHVNILLYPACKILPATSRSYRFGWPHIYFQSNISFCCLFFLKKEKCYFSQTHWLLVSYRTNHKSLFSKARRNSESRLWMGMLQDHVLALSGFLVSWGVFFSWKASDSWPVEVRFFSLPLLSGPFTILLPIAMTCCEGKTGTGS